MNLKDDIEEIIATGEQLPPEMTYADIVETIKDDPTFNGSKIVDSKGGSDDGS